MTAPRSEVDAHNRRAWDREARERGPWSTPVSAEEIAAARRGTWSVRLSPERSVPRSWFGEVEGAAVLGLAAAGGQQAPVLAAAGARVTVLDVSEGQLALDREVASREGLDLRTEHGDMRDLSRFADGSFDLVVHPVSNCFVDALEAIWRECARVLRPGGRLLAGFLHPALFLVDDPFGGGGDPGPAGLRVRHTLPFDESRDLPPEQRKQLVDAGEPLMSSHTLDAQIGAQLRAGFALLDLFEDVGGVPPTRLDPYMKTTLVTLAERRSAS